MSDPEKPEQERSDVLEVGRDEPSPVADNEVAEGISDTVVPDQGDHLVVASSRGAVDTGVTPAMQIASAWAWRFLVVVAAVLVIGYALRYLSEVVVPASCSPHCSSPSRTGCRS